MMEKKHKRIHHNKNQSSENIFVKTNYILAAWRDTLHQVVIVREISLIVFSENLVNWNSQQRLHFAVVIKSPWEENCMQEKKTLIAF